VSINSIGRRRFIMSDPVFGKTWKINKNGSSFAGTGAPATETRYYEKVGEGYKLTVRGSRDGQPYEWGYTVGVDGLPCPVHGRSDVDAIKKHRVNDLITVGSFTNKGEIVASYRREVSPDGDALTVVAAGNLNGGVAYFDVMRYEPAES
jgi:hypothetical protein